MTQQKAPETIADGDLDAVEGGNGVMGDEKAMIRAAKRSSTTDRIVENKDGEKGVLSSLQTG